MKLFIEVVKEDLVLVATAMVMFTMTIVLGARLALYIVVWGNSMIGTAMFVIDAFVLRGFIDSFKETYELKKELERVRR